MRAVLLCSAAILLSFHTASGSVISHWAADNNASDSAGSNDGTLQNGTSFVSGQIGQAFDFDGNDDFVLINDAANLNPTSAISMDAWVRITDDSGNVGDIIGKDGESFDRQYLLAVGIGTRRFRPHIGVPSGFEYFDGATVFDLSEWYHVAMTYDGSFLKLFVNGALDGQQAVTGPIITTTQPLRIGGGAPVGESGVHFRGQIDDVRLYDHALSEKEILARYNQIMKIDGGWDAILPPGLEDYVDVVDNGTDLIDGELVNFLTITVDFKQGPSNGRFPSIPIAFRQTHEDAAEYLVIEEQINFNSSGADWDGFEFTLAGGGDPVFDLAKTEASGGPAPIGYSVAPFTSAQFTDDNTRLALSAGRVADGDVWFPGSGENDGQLWIDVTPGSEGDFSNFTFLQRPMAVPEPGTVSMLAVGLVIILLRRSPNNHG